MHIIYNLSHEKTTFMDHHRDVLIFLLTLCPQCSFLPKFSIHIETKYEDNKGSNDNVSRIC